MKTVAAHDLTLRIRRPGNEHHRQSKASRADRGRSGPRRADECVTDEAVRHRRRFWISFSKGTKELAFGFRL